MAVLPLIKFPGKLLRVKTRPVKSISDVERKLVRDMIETMYAENGVGLAANQVGISKQIFVACADQIRGKELVCFNPKIIKKEGFVKEFEGCLSVPEYYEPVRRSKRVWLKAMNLKGEIVELTADGLLSRIFQHEVDHLNGVLFIDRLGMFKSRMIHRKLKAKILK